jgi:hypothetical protein
MYLELAEMCKSILNGRIVATISNKRVSGIEVVVTYLVNLGV